jgi:hypothetical protein
MSEPISISKEIANKTFSSNAYPPVHKFQSEVNFTDLDVFTQGQPFDDFRKMREEAPVFLHPPFLNDPEPGFWSLTRNYLFSPYQKFLVSLKRTDRNL